MSDLPSTDIKVSVSYNDRIIITRITASMDLVSFYSEIKSLCDFRKDEVFTVKWIDEENDPCVISSQEELDEAIRLYKVNKDSELALHVFNSIPLAAGMRCLGEDENIYRRGARHLRKLYKIDGHIFQTKRFNRRVVCSYCADRICFLGRHGFECIKCQLMIHKKCHKLKKTPCIDNSGINSDIQIGSAPFTNDFNRLSLNQIKTENSLLSRSESPAPQNRTHCQEPLDQDVLVCQKKLDQVDLEFVPEIYQASKNLSSGETLSSSEVSLVDFNLLKVIGRGSYSKVFVVKLKKTKRIYAMKVIKKILVNDEDIDWVQTEKPVFEIASSYPFLVGLHSCFQTPSRLFFVMEFVQGGDLMFHMQTQGRLPEEHARFYAAEISLALNFLHDRGIIYRDLKLDNVLLDHEGHIKLTDYGLCKEGVKSGDTTGSFCGTINYIAPEMLRGEQYDFGVDWWALGVLLYEMLAGHSPFDIGDAAENFNQNTKDYLIQVIIEKKIQIPHSISMKAQSILKRFLNKNPVERLGSFPESGFDNIMAHSFFKSINWKLLEAKQVSPPYIPKIQTETDLQFFDPHFLNEPTILTPDDAENIDQSEYEGFEYINPLLISTEAHV